MSKTNSLDPRAHWRLSISSGLSTIVLKSLIAVAGLLLACSGGAAFAQSIVQVEEDWELDLGTPNTAKGSPQLTCLISPTGDTSSQYVVLQINQRTSPTGKIGGLQQQLCNNGSVVAVDDAKDTAALAASGEKIQWTQRMNISQGTLTVQVVNGTSSTWGKFGGGSDLLVSTSTSIPNLNAYDPNVSSSNSGVDFGTTRVSKLILKKIRTYDSNGKKSVDQAVDRVVFQYP